MRWRRARRAMSGNNQEGGLTMNSVRELVAAARRQIDNLSVDQVARELDSEKVTLVDIREPDEVWSDGTIPGSIQAPRGMLEFYADPASPYYRPEFDPASRIILY